MEEDVFDADFYNPENEVVEPLSDNEKNLKEKDDTKVHVRICLSQSSET